MKTFSPVSSLRKALVAILLAAMAASPAFAERYASIVVDLDTAQVLHARNADDPRYPASLTKVMTLYLVFDALDAGRLKLTDRMPVSRNAQRQQPSRLGLRAGQTIKVEDAIRALVTKSANDVAVVFAEKLGRTEAGFAVMMNAKARELGLLNTTFYNASGLPNPRQTSTARDLARLAEAMFFDHRAQYAYFSTPDFTWRRRHYANHNTLLRSVDGVDGIKTGYTNASGYNLMASAERSGHRVIAVMLGGSSGRSRDQHVADLLEAAFVSINGGELPQDLSDRLAAGAREPAPRQSVAEQLAANQLRAMGGAGETQLASAESTEEPEFAAEGDSSADEGDDEDGDDTAVLQASAPGASTLTAPAASVERAGVQASAAPVPALAAPTAPPTAN
jgi:D-alanyl-D-alanine carboxypeptidase